VSGALARILVALILIFAILLTYAALPHDGVDSSALPTLETDATPVV